MRAAIFVIAVLGISSVVSSALAQSATSTPSVVADVLKLSSAKVDEAVIVAYVESVPPANVSATDLLILHSNGISSRVLVALLNPTQAETAPVTEPIARNFVASAQSPPRIVEPPLVDYVSAPAYVGGGSIYYSDDYWWGVGLGVGWGWGYYAGWGYPWYGYGCYPFYGYYAHHGHHHDHGGHYGYGYHDGYNGHGGGIHYTPDRARTGGSGGSASSRLAGSGTTANRNVPRGNGGNAVTGAGRRVASAGGNTTTRPAPNARTPGTTAGVGRSGSGSAGAAAPVGANRPIASARTAPQSPTMAGRGSVNMAGRGSVSPGRTAPSSYGAPRTVAPTYAGGPSRYQGSPGGVSGNRGVW